MKHLFASVLCLCMVVTTLFLVSGTADAKSYEFKDGIYTYSVSNGKATVKDCDASASGKIVIPSVVPDGCPVTGIGSHAFKECHALSGVVIPDSVTDIGDSAFEDCTALTDVTIGSGVTRIGEYAFSGCSVLTQITIPDSVTSIGHSAFYGCRCLTSVILSKSLIRIEDSLFSGCSSLVSVTLPDGITGIGASAFSKCSNLTSIKLPNSISSIDRFAFYQCSSLTDVRIPSGVTSIGDYAFSYCYSLPRVIIPDRLTHIGSNMFYSCSSLTGVTIPAGVTSIGDSAFFLCSDLRDVYYLGSREQWSKIVFGSYNNQLRGAYIHYHEQHNYESAVTEPSCTEQGYTTHTCIDCGYNCEDTYVDALGHAWDEGIVTKQPTPTENGVKTYTCTRCDATRTESISVTGEKPCDGGDGCQSGKFVDVDSKQWYHPYVDYAVAHGLFGGTSDYTFEPETAMTRAMLVTVLWRYEGQPKGYQNTFSDVNAKSGSWYIDAVAWASANGVVNGVGAGRFDPDGKITREQMATILFRYAQKKEIDTSRRGDVSAFPDANQISGYAKEALSWTVGEGIINGSDNMLQPQGNATRAQVATILMRFIENIVKK